MTRKKFSALRNTWLMYLSYQNWTLSWWVSGKINVVERKRLSCWTLKIGKFSLIRRGRVRSWINSIEICQIISYGLLVWHSIRGSSSLTMTFNYFWTFSHSTKLNLIDWSNDTRKLSWNKQRVRVLCVDLNSKSANFDDTMRKKWIAEKRANKNRNKFVERAEMTRKMTTRYSNEMKLRRAHAITRGLRLSCVCSIWGLFWFVWCRIQHSLLTTTSTWRIWKLLTSPEAPRKSQISSFDSDRRATSSSRVKLHQMKIIIQNKKYEIFFAFMNKFSAEKLWNSMCQLLSIAEFESCFARFMGHNVA